jgi:hypothetical protein
MIVNCFTVIMASQFYETTLKVITNEFGKNIPTSLPYEGGPLGFITHLFCVGANVNIEKIVKDNNCKMTNPYKMEIDDDKYNNKYIIRDTYKKEGAPFCLEIFQKV